MNSNKLTRYGYVIKKDEYEKKDIKKIKSDLTVTPFTMTAYSRFPKNNSFKVYKETKSELCLPRFYSLDVLGKPNKDLLKKRKYEKFKGKYTGTLFPRQQIIVDKTIKSLNEKGGGIIVAGCGSGKTNIAIYLACYYGLKTLFIVHKEFLKTQVYNRVKAVTDIQHVGLIQGKTVRTNSQFVVGMIQTLCKKDYSEIFKQFGMIIIDEVHHMGARNFSNFFHKVSSKYMLGITAEKSRNDGMYKIIKWYMGPICHFEEQRPNNMVIVKRFHYTSIDQKKTKTVLNRFNGEPDRSTMVTNLTLIKKRTRFAYKLLLELFYSGKNILFLSNRLDHIEKIYQLLLNNKYTKESVAKYIGGMDEKSLAISATKQIILGTYSMASEGLDIPDLNVVVLATPKTDVKQSVGRILRKEVYEEAPIVIDIIDEETDIFVNQSKKRLEYFCKQEYNIQNFYVTEDEDDLQNKMLYSDSKSINTAIEKVVTKKDKIDLKNLLKEKKVEYIMESISEEN
jgi:superfamily II DNA or RNA helicase